MTSPRQSFGLAAYSFPFSCGFVRTEGGRSVHHPLDAFQLASAAAERGLRGIETPLQTMLPDLEEVTLDRFRDILEESGLALVVDTGVVDSALLAETLPRAARLGARVVRAMPSNVLEGARARFPGGWAAYMGELCRRIAEITPLLETLGLVLALENHQDVSSDDLIELCEVGRPWIGVTLDVANPLAVGEDPLEFARKVGSWIRNVHLKDYQIHATPSGFRLVRCALGQGVIPFGDLLPLLNEIAPDAPQHIELAALYARHIRLLEDDWWEGYPERDVRTLVPVLRTAVQQSQPGDTDWRTPLERGGTPEEVAQYEWAQLEASVRFLQGGEGTT